MGETWVKNFVRHHRNPGEEARITLRDRNWADEINHPVDVIDRDGSRCITLEYLLKHLNAEEFVVTYYHHDVLRHLRQDVRMLPASSTS